MAKKIDEKKILKKMEKCISKTTKIKKIPTKDFITTSGISSLKIFEIYFSFEQKFKVCFDENEMSIENLNNLEQLANIIAKKMEEANE